MSWVHLQLPVFQLKGLQILNNLFYLNTKIPPHKSEGSPFHVFLPGNERVYDCSPLPEGTLWPAVGGELHQVRNKKGDGSSFSAAATSSSFRLLPPLLVICLLLPLLVFILSSGLQVRKLSFLLSLSLIINCFIMCESWILVADHLGFKTYFCILIIVSI